MPEDSERPKELIEIPIGLERARRLLEARVKEARARAKKEAPELPPDTEALINQAQLAEQNGDLAAAADLYQKVLEIESDNKGALINFGNICLRKDQNFAQAEVLYRRALALDPDYYLGWYNLGNVLEDQGKSTEAVEAYEKAIELNPHYSNTYYNLALLYEQKLLNVEKALLYFERFLKLEPVGEYATYAREAVKRLKLMIKYEGIKLDEE